MTSKAMERKYELTDETREAFGRTLHRIVAVRSFDYVKAGEKGGWIEKESNLSHEGFCWVYDDAMVFADAVVSGNAKVIRHATVCDTAKVYGNAKLMDNAAVYGRAEVYGDAVVYYCAEVYGEAAVCGSAVVYGKAEVCGNAKVHDYAKVFGNAAVYGRAEVYDEASVCGRTDVYGDATVCGDAEVRGDAVLREDAVVRSNRDYIVFKNWWSSGRYFTWTRSNNKWRVGCFYGTGEELVRKAYKDSKQSGREYERIVRYVEETLKADK